MPTRDKIRKMSQIYAVYIEGARVFFVALSYALARFSCGLRVRPSVRLLHAGIESVLMTVGSCSFHRRVAWRF